VLATGFLVLLGLHPISTADKATAADGLGASVVVIPGDRAGKDRFLGDWQGKRIHNDVKLPWKAK